MPARLIKPTSITLHSLNRMLELHEPEENNNTGQHKVEQATTIPQRANGCSLEALPTIMSDQRRQDHQTGVQPTAQGICPIPASL